MLEMREIEWAHARTTRPGLPASPTPVHHRTRRHRENNLPNVRVVAITATSGRQRRSRSKPATTRPRPLWPAIHFAARPILAASSAIWLQRPEVPFGQTKWQDRLVG